MANVRLGREEKCIVDSTADTNLIEDGVQSGGDDQRKHKLDDEEKRSSSGGDDESEYVVDWEGPDDPQNPKK